MKYLPLIWAGLQRKRTRTVFTILSVVVAFFLFGLLQGINQGFNTVVENLNVDRLYVTARTSMTDGLPISYASRLRAVPGVRAVSHWTYFGGYHQNARNPVSVFSTDPDALFEVYRELKVRPEYLDAMNKTRTGALISERLAQEKGWKIGDRVPIGTSIWTTKSGDSTWFFDIVGVFDPTEFSGGLPAFYFNHEYFAENSAFGDGIVHYYIVGVDDPRAATRISLAIDSMFANSANETRTQTESALAQMQIKQIGDLNLIVNGIVGAVLFTLLFLTANTMAQSVRERTAELAVLKTLGFSNPKVLILILGEAALLCLFGAAIGLSLATAVFPALQPIFGAFRMPWIVVAMGAGLALVLALASGLPPALRAQRLKIVDALAGR